MFRNFTLIYMYIKAYHKKTAFNIQNYVYNQLIFVGAPSWPLQGYNPGFIAPTRPDHLHEHCNLMQHWSFPLVQCNQYSYWGGCWKTCYPSPLYHPPVWAWFQPFPEMDMGFTTCEASSCSWPISLGQHGLAPWRMAIDPIMLTQLTKDLCHAESESRPFW